MDIVVKTNPIKGKHVKQLEYKLRHLLSLLII